MLPGPATINNTSTPYVPIPRAQGAQKVPVVKRFEPPDDVPAGGFPDVRFLVVENLRLHLSETFIKLPSAVHETERKTAVRTMVIEHLLFFFRGGSAQEFYCLYCSL